MSATNQKEFSGTLRGWAEKLRIAAPTLQKKIAFDIHAELQKRTPVKTGRARSNYHVSTGTPSREVTEATSPAPFPAIEVTGREDIFIVNNVHYVPYLNNGTTKLAPISFREASMKAVAAKLQSALKKVD